MAGQSIGALDRRIVIQTPTESRDTFGGVTSTWATYATRWANIRYAKNAEAFPADRKTSMYSVHFIVRSDSVTRAATTKMRVSYDSKIYDIRAISERADEYRKMYLLIEAEQKGPDNIG
jgi:SPP1 family predicted phage head-tail adaptor